MGVPQICVVDDDGCTSWRPLATCSTAQVCNSMTGTCDCKNDPQCGATPTEGDFCPTLGATTHSSCLKGSDGCYTVTTDVACASQMTCNSDSVTVVGQGQACGCPSPAADVNGGSSSNAAMNKAPTKLLGTGCSIAQAMAATRVGSPADDAVLVCLNTNGCQIWQISTNCAAQQLTGGTDPVTTLPACVCRKPAKDSQYYVDPEPQMASLMTGQPTGAQFPSACRFQTLTTALQQKPAPSEIIAAHESSSNVHFHTRIGTPGVTDCTAANTCEVFPMVIPAGVHVYTADVGSFNPNHYIIDVDQTPSALGYALWLEDGATLEGFTVDASATNPTGINAGSGVSTVVTSPSQGAWTTSAAIAPVTGTLNQVRILANAASPSAPSQFLLVSAPSTQTALAIKGQAHWSVSYLTIVGGAGTGRGILVNHATDAVAGSTATLTAAHLNIALSAPGATALVVGASVAGDAGNVVTVTNDANDRGRNWISLGPQGTAVVVTGGTATFNGLDIVGLGGGAIRGYQISGSNSPAPMGVNINQGSIVARPGVDGGIGVRATGGLTTINGTHITGPQGNVAAGTSPGLGWIGVDVEQSPGQVQVAGDVTLTGTASLKTIVDTSSLTGANATALAGVVVGTGVEPPGSTRLPRLTVTDNTSITGHLDGLVINNGRVIATGSGFSSSANWRDGLQVFSTINVVGTDPSDPPSRVSISGATFAGNGRLGVLIRDVAPVALDGVKVTGNGVSSVAGNGFRYPNGTGGVDVQRTQSSSGNAFLFNLLNSTVSGNVGCGITLSGGDDTGVNRANPSDPGVRVCGVGVSGSNVPGPVISAVSTNPPMVTTPGTIATNIGGKVAAVIRGNAVQNNTGVGIYLTEARDVDPSSLDDDVTEATLQNNIVTGNLTMVPPAGTEPAAGGIYVASSNYTNTACPAANAGCTSSMLNGVLTADDLACEDSATSVDTTGVVPHKNHTACTRVRMESFLGNTIACNGRAQIGFAIPQRASGTAGAIAPWDIGSNGTIVGVMLPDRCAASATPNRLTGYSGTSMGLAISSAATDPKTSQSLVHVYAYGLFWSTSTLAPGLDYSSSLGASPQGNGDAASPMTWGVCPSAAAATCPYPTAM